MSKPLTHPTPRYVLETEPLRAASACLNLQIQLLSDGAGILLQIHLSSKLELVQTHLYCEAFSGGTGVINQSILPTGCGNHAKVMFDSMTYSLSEVGSAGKLQAQFFNKGGTLLSTEQGFCIKAEP